MIKILKSVAVDFLWLQPCPFLLNPQLSATKLTQSCRFSVDSKDPIPSSLTISIPFLAISCCGKSTSLWPPLALGCSYCTWQVAWDTLELRALPSPPQWAPPTWSVFLSWILQWCLVELHSQKVAHLRKFLCEMEMAPPSKAQTWPWPSLGRGGCLHISLRHGPTYLLSQTAA